MPASRRGLLAALAGGALTGCRAPERADPARGLPAPGATGTAPAPDPAAAAPPVTPTGAPPAEATREAVVARYGSQEPTSWGFDAPGVLTHLPAPADSTGAVALTFDACGGPYGSNYDEALVEALREHRAPATLFLNSRWIEANRSVARALAGDPLFEIANHGTRHCPLSVSGRGAYGIDGTRDAGEVFDEIAGNRAGITALTGRPPRWFRSGTAYLDDVAARIVNDLGERFTGFTVNGDGGATFTAAQVHREVAAAGPGAIVLAHMNHPGGGTAAGVAAALPQLLAEGRHFVRLSDAVG